MAATPVTYKGNFVIADSDYHEIVYTGRTKSGAAIEITLHNAINLENMDLSFQEKNDMVPEITWQGTYANTDNMTRPANEPWEIKCADASLSASSGIVVGAGTVTIDGKEVALTRGGGQFTLERTYREQNADGDMGAVKGRIVIDGSRPKLKLSMLTFISHMDAMFPAISKS